MDWVLKHQNSTWEPFVPLAAFQHVSFLCPLVLHGLFDYCFCHSVHLMRYEVWGPWRALCRGGAEESDGAFRTHLPPSGFELQRKTEIPSKQQWWDIPVSPLERDKLAVSFLSPYRSSCSAGRLYFTCGEAMVWNKDLSHGLFPPKNWGFFSPAKGHVIMASQIIITSKRLSCRSSRLLSRLDASECNKRGKGTREYWEWVLHRSVLVGTAQFIYRSWAKRNKIHRNISLAKRSSVCGFPFIRV